MKKPILLALMLIFMLLGCDTKQKPHLDGKKLLEQKCSTCHNLDLPPKTFDDEIAPPMMAVAFHIRDFIPANNESEKIPKAIEFIKDYVINPSVTKSFCDKKSLQDYGLMPSQKGKVSQDELQAIAEYMFEHYSVKNFTQAQAIRNRLAKMPQGERLAIKYGCLTCHKPTKDLVGPSFSKIAKRYKQDTLAIQYAIKSGSAKKWQGYRGAVMPHFENKIANKDIVTLSKWVAKQ